jgi:hypothetical protein
MRPVPEKNANSNRKKRKKNTKPNQQKWPRASNPRPPTSQFFTLFFFDLKSSSRMLHTNRNRLKSRFRGSTHRPDPGGRGGRGPGRPVISGIPRSQAGSGKEKLTAVSVLSPAPPGSWGVDSPPLVRFASQLAACALGAQAKFNGTNIALAGVTAAMPLHYSRSLSTAPAVISAHFHTSYFIRSSAFSAKEAPSAAPTAIKTAHSHSRLTHGPIYFNNSLMRKAPQALGQRYFSCDQKSGQGWPMNTVESLPAAL